MSVHSCIEHLCLKSEKKQKKNFKVSKQHKKTRLYSIKKVVITFLKQQCQICISKTAAEFL